MNFLPAKLGETIFGRKANTFMAVVALKRRIADLEEELKELKKERKEWVEQREVMQTMVLKLAEGKLDAKNIDVGGLF